MQLFFSSASAAAVLSPSFRMILYLHVDNKHEVVVGEETVRGFKTARPAVLV